MAGHPFKGGWVYSSGMLANPEIKKFQINTPVLFSPPNPAKMPGAAASCAAVPSFGSFFSAYFGGATYNLGDNKCGKMLEGMKRCYESNKADDPVSHCSYYIDGFKRMACAK